MSDRTERWSTAIRGCVEAVLGAKLPAGAFASFGLRVGQLGLEFLCLLLLAHVLDPSAFGIYAIAMSSAILLGVPAAAGFDRLLIREVAAYRAVANWGAMRGIVRRGTQLALASSGVLALALFAWSYHATAEALRNGLWMAALLLPFVAFARLRQAAIQGLGNVPAGMFPEALVQPASMLVLAACTFSFGGLERTGVNALALQILAAIVAMSTGIVILRRLWPKDAHGARPLLETRRWLTSAMPLMWMLGMNMLLTSADTIMLGWLSGESEAGQYRVAAQVAMLVGFPMTAINLAVAPMLARSYAIGDRESLKVDVSRASRWALATAVPIALLLWLTGDIALSWFGATFVAAKPALSILVCGYLVNVLGGAAGYLLIMSGRERVAAWVFSAAALLNLVANYLLIPALGMIGAALATAASAALVGVGFLVASRRGVT